MNSRHTQNGTLREYLLRTLPDEKAEAIEERYFTDALFFNKLRTVEVQLICDYLDGNLNADERERFEGRYLHVDTLHKLVEDVHRRRVAAQRAAQRRLLGAALAGALAVCVVVVGAMLRHHGAQSPSTPGQMASVGHAAARLGVVLTQLTKGTGQSTPTLTLPDGPEQVFLAAQLPGQSSSATYTVRIFNVDLGGEHKNVWIARGIRSISRDGGQQVRVELPSSALLSGDYILELETETGNIREGYVFRVNPSRKPANP